MPKIWECNKPCLLNNVVCIAYLLSLDPMIMAFTSQPENRDIGERLAYEFLFSQLVVPNIFLCREKWEQEKTRLMSIFSRNIMTSGPSRWTSSWGTFESQTRVSTALPTSGTRTTKVHSPRYLWSWGARHCQSCWELGRQSGNATMWSTMRKDKEPIWGQRRPRNRWQSKQYTAMRSQLFIGWQPRRQASCMKTWILHSFIIKGFGMQWRGFPCIHSEHDMRLQANAVEEHRRWSVCSMINCKIWQPEISLYWWSSAWFQRCSGWFHSWWWLLCTLEIERECIREANKGIKVQVLHFTLFSWISH